MNLDPKDFCGPAVPSLTTARDAFDYNMFHKERGVCLILEYETFSSSSLATRSLMRRHGSQVDSDNIIRLFSQLGFEVLLQKDLTVAATRLVLEQVSALNHSDSDCFVCFVLTHGDYGELYAHDGKFRIELLFRSFLGDSCRTLLGKPKLFFIQACQGNRLDDGVLVRGSRDAVDAVSYFKIPTYADFLIAYSTIPGFYAFRNTEKGSWFIRALVQVIHENHMQLDLLSMMTMVSQKVAYEFTSQAALPMLSQKKQVPCITSMLTRRVFLLPKSLQL